MTRTKIADAREAPTGGRAVLAGFGPLLRMHLLRIRRAWPGPVVIGAFLFLAVLSPVTARFAPDLLGSLVPEIPIELPDPTWVDSYAQWLKNLTQIGTLLAIVAAAGSIAGETDTAVLVLTKPASRAAYVLSAFVANALLVLVAALAGTVVTAALTVAMFPGAPLGPLVGATAVWLLSALVLMAVTIWVSAAVSAPLPAVGIGIAAWLVLSLAGAWEPLARYTPAGLAGAATQVSAGSDAAVAWPVLAGIALTALLLAGAVATFRRREL